MPRTFAHAAILDAVSRALRPRQAISLAVALGAALALAAGVGAALHSPSRSGLVRVWPIDYAAHDGRVRHAYVVLPAWYGPRDDPPLPLVISPHGRGVPAIENVASWGQLPARGGFAVVNPEGQGRRLVLYSWGDPGEIGDLSRMPAIVERALPWLRVAPDRVYAFGTSQGGQETLLLAAEHPGLLAGAAAFDAPTNLAERYRDFSRLRHGFVLRRMMRREVGGTPRQDPRAYRSRSPLDRARALAFSGVPLQLWWSRRDRVVVDQEAESGALYRAIKRLNPDAPVVQFVGNWAHSADFASNRKLPEALRLFGLLPRTTVA
jgi:dipeptidyl aminopeptidase/acylaminoacyl peptidase